MPDKNKRKRVVFFLPSLECGGAERNVLNFMKGLSKDYEPGLVLARKKGFFLKDIPGRVNIVDFKSDFLPVILAKEILFLNKHAPDIFISTFPRFNFVNLLAKFFSRRKFYFVIVEQTTPSKLSATAKKLLHKVVARYFLKFLLNFFYLKADKIICVSSAVKKDLEGFIKMPLRTEVIYNPVVGKNILKLSTQETVHPWLANKDFPVVLAMGRLVEAKDYPTLLSAFALVLAEKPARFIILGDGEERRKLEKISKELGIAKNLDFLGFQKNPYKFLGRASVFVSASKREGFSNSIIEALALGIPTIATKSEGPGEIIENGKNGILVPIGDAKALAKAILEVLNSRALQQKLSDAGKTRAQDFTIEKSIKAYSAIFEELLNSPQK